MNLRSRFRRIFSAGKSEPPPVSGAASLSSWFRRFQLEKIQLTQNGARIEISFKPEDQDAAWELYIDMLTRIVTQELPDEVGDEQTALDSVYSLFAITREILRRRGRRTIDFTKVAVPVLNQVVRPFTAKWHRESLSGAFDDDDKCREFRAELASLRDDLRNYNRMLADIAGVEDLTDMELIDGG